MSGTFESTGSSGGGSIDFSTKFQNGLTWDAVASKAQLGSDVSMTVADAWLSDRYLYAGTKSLEMSDGGGNIFTTAVGKIYFGWSRSALPANAEKVNINGRLRIGDSGTDNIKIGYLNNGTVSTGCIHIGNQAGYNFSGAYSYNNFIGYSAGYVGTGGGDNNFFGRVSGGGLNGQLNVGMGLASNFYNTGNGNVALGSYAMFKDWSYGANNTGQTQNVAIGYYAHSGIHNSNAYNTAIGSGAMTNVNNSVSRVLALGYMAGNLCNTGWCTIIGNDNLPRFAGAAAAAAALPPAGPNGVYIYWDTVTNALMVRP